MNVLALDLGSKCGWATCSRDGLIAGGTENFSTARHQGHGRRWLAFREFLSERRSALGAIETVYYEDVKQHAGTLAAHAYGGFLAMLECWCAVNNVRLEPVGVGVVKKHWTGKGNADKQAMIVAAAAKGFCPVDDNHADALAILSLARTLEGLA